MADELSEEHKQRIQQEEWQRLAEEQYRAQVRRRCSSGAIFRRLAVGYKLPKKLTSAFPIFVMASHGFVLSGYAQQPQHAIPPIQVFSPDAFFRIWSLSTESDPFRPIRGEFDPRTNGWRVNFDLPGASECRVHFDIQGRRLAGTERELPVYECDFGAPDEVDHAFDKLLKQILALNRNWRTMPDLCEQLIPIRSFEMFHEHVGASVTFVSRDDENVERHKSSKCFQPRHLSVSWTKIMRSPPVASLGIQIYPPSIAPPGRGKCPAVY